MPHWHCQGGTCCTKGVIMSGPLCRGDHWCCWKTSCQCLATGQRKIPWSTPRELFWTDSSELASSRKAEDILKSNVLKTDLAFVSVRLSLLPWRMHEAGVRLVDSIDILDMWNQNWRAFQRGWVSSAFWEWRCAISIRNGFTRCCRPEGNFHG